MARKIRAKLIMELREQGANVKQFFLCRVSISSFTSVR